MKAPDKIYLAESDSIKGEVTSNFASSTPFRRHDSIAYIRKDALLEKLNHARGLRIKSGAKESSDGIRVIDALIDLINKL